MHFELVKVMLLDWEFPPLFKILGFVRIMKGAKEEKKAKRNLHSLIWFRLERTKENYIIWKLFKNVYIFKLAIVYIEEKIREVNLKKYVKKWFEFKSNFYFSSRPFPPSIFLLCSFLQLYQDWNEALRIVDLWCCNWIIKMKWKLHSAELETVSFTVF